MWFLSYLSPLNAKSLGIVEYLFLSDKAAILFTHTEGISLECFSFLFFLQSREDAFV